MLDAEMILFLNVSYTFLVNVCELCFVFVKLCLFEQFAYSLYSALLIVSMRCLLYLWEPCAIYRLLLSIYPIAYDCIYNNLQ